MDFTFPYPSRRMPVLARNVVATSQPLAVQAGIKALHDGGNAVDAAVAAAITLTVVEPSSNGIGGDAFCMVWDGARLHGLNACGRSPAAVTADDFAGRQSMPLYGWDAVTVPGCVSAWVELSRRFGKLPFARLFDAAINYARHGFAVSPFTARDWAQAQQTFRGTAAGAHRDELSKLNQLEQNGLSEFAQFLPNGKAPLAGQVFAFPQQAETLEAIAASHGESFYRGALAEKIAAAAAAAGAKLTLADLAAHRCDWTPPIAHTYHSNAYGAVEVHEMPPNGQGLAAQIMLGIVAHHGCGGRAGINCYALDSADFFHLQIEAMKLALADAHRYIADDEYLEFPPQRLLAADYLKQRSELIDMRRAGQPTFGAPAAGDTVYLASADQHGMMVSFIQSNFYDFGCGIVIPGTGINMQNRAAAFSLTPGHRNQIAGGKRPFHTILPGFVTQGGKPLLSFGVMGGPMQAQGHAQMIIRICDYRQNPQTASDAPRWQVLPGNRVALEGGVAEEVKNELARRGHALVNAEALEQDFSMGGAQLIYRGADGYIAGSDSRKDGMAAGF